MKTQKQRLVEIAKFLFENGIINSEKYQAKLKKLNHVE